MPGYREITVAGEGRPRRPARRGPAPAPRDWRAAFGDVLSGTIALCRQSPGAVMGVLIGIGTAGYVCFNALGHQTGPHPAPILPKVAAKEPAREPVREVARDTAKDVPKEAARDLQKPVPRQAARDAIGDLIRADETTASVTPKGDAKATAKALDKSAKPAADTAESPVLRAQRALAKLGYGPVKPDGAMGPGTKAAIEKFERDRKLPVTGEAAGRTLRALMSSAGQG